MSFLHRFVTKYNLIKFLSTTKQNDYKPVYKFPYIRGIGLINRLKLYHTVLTTAAIPTTTILNQLNIISYDQILITAIVSLGGIVPLYGFGYFSNKLVGIVYLNEKEEKVKFAYLDFWGARKDVIIPVSDIVPLSEVSRALTDPLYSRIQQFSSKETFKLCTKYGVLDDVGFNKIF